MTERDKYTRIEGPNGQTLIVQTFTTHDGTDLTIPTPTRHLIDTIPTPKEAVRDMMEGGLREFEVNYPWTRGATAK